MQGLCAKRFTQYYVLNDLKIILSVYIAQLFLPFAAPIPNFLSVLWAFRFKMSVNICFLFQQLVCCHWTTVKQIFCLYCSYCVIVPLATEFFPLSGIKRNWDGIHFNDTVRKHAKNKI